MPLHAPSGAQNVTVVNGSTPVGRYAADGSLNVTQANVGTRPKTRLHPCGALNVTLVTGGHGKYAPDGSVRVSTTNTPGCMLVNVVSGSLT